MIKIPLIIHLVETITLLLGNGKVCDHTFDLSQKCSKILLICLQTEISD